MMHCASKMIYLIASHVKYMHVCLPKLLESLTIPKENLILTIAGAEEALQTVYQNITCFYETHNSFEYSSLISLIEHELRPAPYVFLLHDTMICGPNFYELSRQMPHDSEVCACHPRGICNVAAFQTDYLYKIKSRILNLKNCDKKTGIIAEGNFFKDANRAFYAQAGLEERGWKDFYQTNTLRNELYFPSVDLYKYGANNGETMRQGKFVLTP